VNRHPKFISLHDPYSTLPCSPSYSRFVYKIKRPSDICTSLSHPRVVIWREQGQNSSHECVYPIADFWLQQTRNANHKSSFAAQTITNHKYTHTGAHWHKTKNKHSLLAFEKLHRNKEKEMSLDSTSEKKKPVFLHHLSPLETRSERNDGPSQRSSTHSLTAEGVKSKKTSLEEKRS